MRKSKAEKAETRKHIVETASRMFKERGIGATGVGEIMVAAGLTHSAFYRHFSSKEELVAEASSSSMEVFVEAAHTAMKAGPRAFAKYLQNYLNSEYRNGTLGGCPVVQMGSELAREAEVTRQGVSNGLERLIEFALHSTDGSADAEADALFMMSAIIGAISVSRLVTNAALSAHVVEVVRERLAYRPTRQVGQELAKAPAVRKARKVSVQA
ncbi:TetR/AcrR family transcriptional regulator [Caballeronia insecticola]|uniref:Transcriptional regulator TetR family n=1 Tax=Caballeronia insecticola TaxID=758793 RepID=R4WUL9_9BURK|nr:TetR/AcrR family transcriptional regulator [Caballeronia insecticola]BAN28229.1 transcriptional regulator TetR family [Caballeronia insecticola]